MSEYGFLVMTSDIKSLTNISSTGATKFKAIVMKTLR